jgi:hypothetical protein
MLKQDAINLLIQVAHLAQERGLLRLSDALQVAKAIEVLNDPEDQPQARMQIERPEPNEVGGGTMGSPRFPGDGRPRK